MFQPGSRSNPTSLRPRGSTAHYCRTGQAARGVLVGEIVPTGFEAYARVFHPARDPTGTERRRWAEVAAERGRIVHPEMQFEHLAGTANLETEAWDRQVPLYGCLPEEECAILAEILTSFTRTSGECWFCVWDGYGFHGGGTSLTVVERESPDAVRERERIALERGRREAEQLSKIPVVLVHPDPGGRGSFRSYSLFAGQVRAASRLEFNGSYQSPNLWWPRDREWIVATEIDGYSTYVAGTRGCIDAVLSDPRLESLPTSTDRRFDLGSDQINPSPTRPQRDPGLTCGNRGHTEGVIPTA
jgi:hypothetical protein